MLNAAPGDNTPSGVPFLNLTIAVTVMKASLFSLAACLFLLPASADGVFLKPYGSRVEIYSLSGSYKGSISCSDAIDAQSDGNVIAVLVSSSRVELYTTDGSYKCSVSVSGGRHIQVCGGRVAVTLGNGRTEIYGSDGCYCGSF